MRLDRIGASVASVLLGGMLVAGPSAAQQPADDASIVAVLNEPAGDTLATVRSAAATTVLEASGEWARVRVEGWTPLGEVTATAGRSPVPLRLADLRADPLRHQGARVRWRVQFVALQRADHLRTDMEPGAHYLLARDPGGEPGFVYALVPEDVLPAIRQLAPLQRLEILATVRNGSSPLTGHPILELVEVRELQER